MSEKERVIGIVGPSKSGKSTLQQGLSKHGYQCKHIAQEHSFVPNMWNVIANPDVLIYLDVSFENSMKRGQPRWNEADYQEELNRLRQARAHADLYVQTDDVNADNVLTQALAFLEG
ncbi:MAG: hypothetical protein OEV06_10730 [Anaerolineae bacterium]|nr:hypothetical protein [Anaerolineae bacterium]